MSDIISDLAPTKAEAPAALSTKRSREEEFRSSLDRYIARYQRRHAVPLPSTGRDDSVSYLSYFAGLGGRIARWAAFTAPARS
jgi:hypothetical protein